MFGLLVAMNVGIVGGRRDMGEAESFGMVRLCKGREED